MSHLIALLHEIRRSRVGLYVGAASLPKLADFLRGYDHAVRRLAPHEADGFLAEFRDWIYGRFQTTENASWEAVIRRHSADEADALKRFWELLDEYQHVNGGRETAPAVPGMKAPRDPAEPLGRLPAR